MITEAWHGISVSKHTVAVTVGEVKEALKEYGPWISYRPKLGYRLEVPQSDDLIRNGRHFWVRHTREGFEKALVCFQQAALENGTDFRAFEGIALSYLMLGTFGMRPPGEMYAEFLEAHGHAVALCGLTPELRSDRAQGLHVFERKFEEAEAELLQALRDKPSLATAGVRLTMLYATWGRLDEALNAVVQARTSDALWPILPSAEIFVRLCRREFDCAVACGKKAIELHPYLAIGRAFYAGALEAAGQMDEAVAQYRLARVMSPDLPWLRAMEAACLAKGGQRSEASRILEELQEFRLTEYLDPYYLAMLLGALGRRDEAFQELERAHEENSATLFILDADVRMDPLRADPRFTPLRNKVFGTAAACMQRR